MCSCSYETKISYSIMRDLLFFSKELEQEFQKVRIGSLKDAYKDTLKFRIRTTYGPPCCQN